MNIEMYSRDGCSYCIRAKELLRSRNIAYTEIKLEGDVNKATIEARLDEGSEARVNTIPQIFIDDKHIGGYLQLVEYLAANPQL